MNWEVLAGVKKMNDEGTGLVDHSLDNDPFKDRDNPHGKFNAKEISQIYSMLDQGDFCRDIVNKLAISASTMSKYKKIWIANGGVYVGIRLNKEQRQAATAKQKAATAKNQLAWKNKREDMSRLMDQGFKNNQIGAKLSISHGAVTRARGRWKLRTTPLPRGV